MLRRFGRGANKGWDSTLFVIHDIPHLDSPFEERYARSSLALNTLFLISTTLQLITS